MSDKTKFSNFKNSPWRLGQQEAADIISNSTRKVVVVMAPTGSGKSLIGMSAAATQPRACYLCSSKMLQRQLESDFPEAMLMMGRNNFTCAADHNRMADLCTHTPSTPCPKKHSCPYEVYKRRVLKHPLQILNYPYLLTEANYVGQFSGYPLVVADEADVIEGVLTGFVELRIIERRLKALKIDPPRRRTSTARDGLSAWHEWAEKVSEGRVGARLREVQDYVDNLDPEDELSPNDTAMVRELKDLEGLMNKLTMFINHMDDTWIFQEIPRRDGSIDGWSFQPTWLNPALSEQYLWRHATRWGLMSATFPPKAVLAQTLGLSTGDIEYIEIPSTFPAANRPVYLDPVADMGYKTFNESLPLLIKEIDRILALHPNERGVIHTVSWKLNKAIMDMGNGRFVTHNNGNKDAELERFGKSKNGVFVSPSSTRGLNLPDDACRFIIIAKAPFQSLGDKLVSARVHGSGLGAFWYRAIAAQDIVQASGRGMRHDHDRCVTYLLDKQIEKLVVDNQSLFPGWWREAVDYLYIWPNLAMGSLYNRRSPPTASGCGVGY